VRRRFGDAVELHEIDYGRPIPWDKIEAAETVIITDFSLPKDDMLKIYEAKGENFIWIDHHISAIEEMSDFESIAGLRALDRAACVLTWQYFLPESSVPAAVLFIGDRDIWQFDYPQTRVFSEGLSAEDTAVNNNALWDALLSNDQELVQRLIEKGEILLDARLKQIAYHVDTYGFALDFDGYNTLAVNLPGNGDIGHYICSLGYDVAYVYRDNFQDGQVFTNVTLYSETVDVSKLAMRYGGGGHKGAAGFRFMRSGNSPLPVAF
ncbi:MAG TPA: hypothetical protein G4N96_14390, partial [Chloroflexi bacterium]|nr:hypothetical protein [Chloroflexota bacterium]